MSGEKTPDDELGDMDDLQRMIFEMFFGALPENEVDQLLADRKREAKREAEKLG